MLKIKIIFPNFPRCIYLTLYSPLRYNIIINYTRKPLYIMAYLFETQKLLLKVLLVEMYGLVAWQIISDSSLTSK